MISAESQGPSLKVLPEQSNSSEKVGVDARKGQKQGLLDPARDLVLEPSLGEKPPVLGNGDRSGTQPPCVAQNHESRFAKRKWCQEN